MTAALGRLAPTITRVIVTLADGQTVSASAGNEFWLAWWPNEVAATAVTGFDEAGLEVTTVEVPE